MTAEIVPFPAPPSRRLVAASEPIAAWRLPSGALLPAAAVVGAPHPDLQPVVARELMPSTPAEAELFGLLPSRAPAADVWTDRGSSLRPPVAATELVVPRPPSWWSAWLASFKAQPGAHVAVFAGVALASTLALIGVGRL